MPWAAVPTNNRSVTEVHVIPLQVSPMHTVPICWCRPIRKTTERIWTHQLV